MSRQKKVSAPGFHQLMVYVFLYQFVAKLLESYKTPTQTVQKKLQIILKNQYKSKRHTQLKGDENPNSCPTKQCLTWSYTHFSR